MMAEFSIPAATSTPRILWLESGDLYTIRRALAVAPNHGVIVEHRDLADLVFAAGDRASIAFQGEDLVARYDAVIMRTFSPFISEALTVARLFRAAGKIVVDQSLTDEGYAMSKMHDYLLLTQAGLGVPRTIQASDEKTLLAAAETLGFPCVVKSTFGACGRYVFKAENRNECAKILAQEPLGHWLVQEFLPAKEDYRVMVIGGEALPVLVKREPKGTDFRTNFDLESRLTAAPTADYPELKTLAEAAARTLRREFTGVDIRYRGQTPLILEANRRPGFEGFETTTGYNVAGALLDYVKGLCAGRPRLLS